MTRSDILLYRNAFDALITCAASPAEPAHCSEAFAATVAPLQDDPEVDERLARGMSRNYVESVLRKGGVRADCVS